MTFLNAALAFGAAALAIPILIHLFHKSRFQVVKWGAMHLLEAVIRTNQRRIRIEQIILLIIRAAIPVLLALCMARPVWTGVQKLLGNAKSSTVVLLDNSYSMDGSHSGVSNFAIARDEAARLIAELQPGSSAQVGLLGEGGASLFDEPTYDTTRLSRAVAQLSAGFGAATVPAALEYATGVFNQMHEPARSLVVFTDFQRISFEGRESAALKDAIQRLRQLPIPPEITFFETGTEVKDNVAIESLEFSRLMIGVGQKLQIRANLRNFGSGSYPDLRVYFKADGKERSASRLALGPQEKGQVLFTHSFETAGSHVVEVVADADALKADNVFMAAIPVRDKVPVLLVNGDPNSEPLKGETDFAEIALQPYSAGRVELADLITTRVIRAEELEAGKLAGAAVVLLANVRKLNEGQLRELEEFVRNGGGLLVFGGNRVEPTWYNGAFFNGGKGLLPGPLGPLAGELKETSPPVAVLAQRYENAALELFNEPRNGSLSETGIKLYFKLQTPADGSMTTLARLENGDPFLVEKPFGEGRVILCATAVDADWSNLPLRPTYLPLLQRLTVYLASTVYPPRNLDVGKPLVAFLAASEAGKKAMVTMPDGSTSELPIAQRGTRGVVEFARTQPPGLYTLTSPGASPIHFVVNASRRESDLQKLTAAEIDDFGREHGVAIVRSGSDYKAREQSRRFGHELWKPLLWVLLGLLFVEMVIQQRFAGVRRKA